MKDSILNLKKSISARQISDRSEWAVNALGSVMLAVPYLPHAQPTAIEQTGSGCRIRFSDGEAYMVPVPPLVRPFLDQARTALVVTFRRTRIVEETTLFVVHAEAEGDD